MLNNSSKFTPKYLPFKEFHIARITGIGPDFLRGSAKRLANDREAIKHTTALNFICKALGFRAGFAGYNKDYSKNLQAFMCRHGFKREGLTEPKVADSSISIDLQQISDRCFRSDRELPSRVFTGAGVDWFDLLEAALAIQALEICNKFTGQRIIHSADVAKIRGDIPAQWVIQHGVKRLCFHDGFSLRTLIGDQLLQFAETAVTAEKTNVATYYCPQSMSAEEVAHETERLNGAADILSQIIKTMGRGWIDIVPYNENLIFLSDGTGGYDFVFPRLQIAAFNHNIHAPYLKNADVPKSDDYYHFLRWRYFEDSGWRERDEHEAEVLFYAQGGGVNDYPGIEALHRAYSLKSGRYTPPFEKASLAAGFKRVNIGTKALAVSDPISVEKFRQFMTQENELYAKYRPKPPEQDDWQQTNQLDDVTSAPAAVTWFDASAFIANVSKKEKLPVRLATEEEWLAITMELRSDIQVDQEAIERMLKCRIVERGERDEHHDYFGTSYSCSEAELPWARTKAGISVLRSIDSGEWLLPKGAAINCLHFGAMNLSPLHFSYGDRIDWSKRVSASTDRMAPESTGAYKDMRIGFRMVYELNKGGQHEHNPKD